MRREIRSKHEAFEWKLNGIRDGLYKDCCHLKVIGISPYALQCEEKSFEIKGGGVGEGCPAGCHLFEDRAAQEREEKDRKQREVFWERAKAIKSFIAEPFNWFAKLGATTQALLILIPLAYFSPRIAISIATILKALKDVFRRQKYLSPWLST